MIRRASLVFLIFTLAVVVGASCYIGLLNNFAFRLASGENFSYANFSNVKEIKLSKNYLDPYFKLYIDYEVAPFSGGYHDLFQTSDVNSGVRMEFTDRTSAIVYATADGSGGFGVQIHNLVRLNHRQSMTVRAIDGKYVWVEDSETGDHYVASPIPHFTLNHILIGQGFDSSRAFFGKIYKVNFSVCEYKVYRNVLIFMYFFVLVFYSICFYALASIFVKK